MSRVSDSEIARKGFRVSPREHGEVMQHLIKSGEIVVLPMPEKPGAGRPVTRYAVASGGVATEDGEE